MPARLGYAVFLASILLAVLIVLGSFCIVAWNLWSDWPCLVRACGQPNAEGLRWRLDFWFWFWNQAMIVGVAVIFAVISLLLGAVTCYVLRGFPTQQRNSN